MKRLPVLAASALLLAGLGTAAAIAPAAHASSGEITADGGINGNGDALNNWFTKGNVYSYTAGKSNEAFNAQYVGRCNGNEVTATCPFTSTSKDEALINDPIVQLIYNEFSNGNTCVGGSTNGGGAIAVLDGCNSVVTGTGGGLWTVFVEAGNDTLVSVGATNSGGTWYQLQGATTSSQVTFNADGSNATEWDAPPGP
jgi:hypothetical protein